MQIDLRTLPAASRYEDRYQQYMDLFNRVAHTPGEVPITVNEPPWSWVPLLEHLRCVCVEPRVAFEHCAIVANAHNTPSDRTYVEVMCGFRPETVDALWKCDMQWDVPKGRVRQYLPKNEFIVTTNGAFHRPEVMAFGDVLRDYKPMKRQVLLVPCAADKPYPSPLHQKCLELMPDDFYLMNATGVLGLVPQDLWSVMPWYDSGIPNEWRLMNTVAWYFNRFPHDRVVVYCDFYSTAIQYGLNRINHPARFVLPVKQYDDYVDLLKPDLLVKLESALKT